MTDSGRSPTIPLDGVAGSIYERLIDEEDARVCTDIPEAACRETPRSFVLMLASLTLTKLGDALINPKTVLAWVMTVLGAPVALLGFLVPIRESGSLIPQLVIASYVRAVAVRKWVWVAGSLLQGVFVTGIGVVALTLTGAAAGWAILALLTGFSLARGLCSVASKDVLGKTVPKRRRGRLTGWSASAAGAITMIFGGALAFGLLEPEDPGFFALLFALAGLAWLAGAALYGLIREVPGETTGGGNALSEALERLDLLRSDAPFRRFVLTRALFLCSALSAPYFVALAQQRVGSPGLLLGLLVVAGGLASLVAAPVWGRAADRSSRRTMTLAATLAGGVGLAVFLADRLAPELVASMWFIPAMFFVLAIAHSGVRVGRKTYVVDLAGGNRRTDYVAVSNSVIGVLLLAAGVAGTLAALFSLGAVILALALAGFAGALLSRTLPEAQ